MRLWAAGTAIGVDKTVVARVVTHPSNARGDPNDHVLVGTCDVLDQCRSGLGAVGAIVELGRGDFEALNAPKRIVGVPNLEYLSDGDILALRPNGTVSVLFRRDSRHNTILATEQCNSFCLMCSQPPREEDDSYRVEEILRLIELIDSSPVELGISGGEPTLLGDGFFQIVELAQKSLPSTALHILTNGRKFRRRELADRLGSIRHHDLVLGIPLYSDIDARHDYVVQRAGAYSETIAGFHNLARAGVRTELRVVLHQQTVERLPQLAEFIARNLPFVEHVALMGLEMYGFAPRNLDVLWVDPAEYVEPLRDAVRHLARAGMQVSIYNHQLCTLPKDLWFFAVRSISDWKNVFLPECQGCAAKPFCAGFFQSGTKRHSQQIRAFPSLSHELRGALSDLHGLSP